MAKNFEFDPETGEFYTEQPDIPVSEPLPEDTVETEFVPIQSEDSAFAFNPGGDSVEVLSPPQTFYVPAGLDGQRVRINPDGSVVVDVTIEIDDGNNNNEYEVRVTT